MDVARSASQGAHYHVVVACNWRDIVAIIRGAASRRLVESTMSSDFLAVEPNVLSSPCHRVGVPVFLFPQHGQDGQHTKCAMSAVVRIASVRVAGSTYPPTGPIQC